MPPPPVLSESVGKTFVFHGGGQKEIQPLCRVDPFTNHHSVWQVLYEATRRDHVNTHASSCFVPHVMDITCLRGGEEIKRARWLLSMFCGRSWASRPPNSSSTVQLAFVSHKPLASPVRVTTIVASYWGLRRRGIYRDALELSVYFRPTSYRGLLQFYNTPQSKPLSEEG